MEKNVNKKLTIQQPKWDDEKQFQLIIEQIKSYPNLVSTNEIRVLKNQLTSMEFKCFTRRDMKNVLNFE